MAVDFKDIEGFQVKTEVFGMHGKGLSRKVELVTTIRNNYLEIVYEIWDGIDVKYAHNIHDAITRYNSL